MNKTEILNEIRDYVQESSITEGKIQNITTNIEDSKPEDLVFYFIRDDKKALDLFYERLKKSNPGLVITNREIKDVDYIHLLEIDFLKVQKQIADVFYPNKNHLKIFGVTGTNGKTTVTSLAMQISEQFGKKSFSVGTIGVMDSIGEIYPSPHATTPSYLEIRKIIHKFQDSYENMFIEVSSHALDQNRLFDLMLEEAAFVSFSLDHLDYHKTKSDYLRAKLKITKSLRSDARLIIPSSEVELLKQVRKEITNKNLLRETKKIREGLPLAFLPLYNRNNLEVAVELCKKIGVCEEIDFNRLKMPKGRFEAIEEKNRIVIIDYAHTPDALENICRATKEACPGRRLITVFGCGGDRDKTKRPLMGKAASDYSDKIIVTSDNPRSEEPAEIIKSIVMGIRGNEYIIEEDRECAIALAINESCERDVVIIAGKGHEEYQEIKGHKKKFSDVEMAQKYLREL